MRRRLMRRRDPGKGRRRPFRRRTWNVTGITTGALVLLVAVIATGCIVKDAGPQSPVTPLYAHLERFQALAEEHGDRAAGTPGYEAAAQYVEQQLESAGFDSSRQYFTVDDDGEEIETFNIIAETEAGSDDDVIMLGAHLDGVPGSPAINDNASGVAALLEAARELGRQDGIRNKVRFAWWGAEEFRRPYGSRHYVEELDEHDELESISAYLNVDMVASTNSVIAVYDARDSEASLDIPEGSVKIMRFFVDYFNARKQPWVTSGWDFSSDQRPFARSDVPVGGLFAGSDERKSSKEARLFGGTAKAPRDPNYHTPQDDINNVDLETLDIMSDALTHAATTWAQDSSALK
jgi:Zn-dependent M28 family amino/carboxypeptidase